MQPFKSVFTMGTVLVVFMSFSVLLFCQLLAIYEHRIQANYMMFYTGIVEKHKTFPVNY